MNQYVWDEQYTVGDELTDQQHKDFFDLANQIVTAKNHAASINAIMLLYKHVREHFKQEETFMRQQNYPGYAAHVNAHNSLIDILNAHSVQLHVEQFKERDLEQFMQRWINHIVIDDLAVKSFMLSTREN